LGLTYVQKEQRIPFELLWNFQKPVFFLCHLLESIATYMKMLLQERGCTETQYMAGMWRAMLPANLTWNVHGAGTRPTDSQIPSWSWASLHGKVNLPLMEPYDGHREELLCELLPFGAGDGAKEQNENVPYHSLVLKGKLALAKLHHTLH
jgi:hypothetical protein